MMEPGNTPNQVPVPMKIEELEKHKKLLFEKRIEKLIEELRGYNWIKAEKFSKQFKYYKKKLNLENLELLLERLVKEIKKEKRKTYLEELKFECDADWWDVYWAKLGLKDLY